MFKNIELIKLIDLGNSDFLGNKNETPKDSGLFGSFTSFFNSAKNKVVDTSQKLSDKISKMEIKEKLITTGQKTFVTMKGIGGVVVDKSKDLYVNIIITENLIILFKFNKS